MTESEVVILHKEINKLHDKMNALTGTVQEQAVTIQTQAKRIDEHTKLFAFYDSVNMPTSKPSRYNQERKKFKERRGENPVGSPER